MWVILVVSILNKEYDKGRIYNLQTKYQEIPGDLHELFRNILTRDSCEKSRETLRCLQWILFAERPLRPDELYFAILVDCSRALTHGEVSKHDIQRFILDSSLGFADIIASNDYKHKTVQFIHESVKDFLLKENGLREVWTDSNINIQEQSHEDLKQCCLRWIGMNSILRSQDSSSEERVILGRSAREELSFLDFAVHNALYHANAAQKYGISQAEFLKEFEADTWKLVRSRFQDEREYPDPRLLYTLAEKNMSHLIGCHPSKTTFSEVGAERFGTPLFQALVKGSNEAVLEFLKAQAESTPEFQDLFEEYCRKPLYLNHFHQSFTFFRYSNILSHFTHPDEGNRILQVAFLLNMHHPYPNLDWANECSQSPLLYVYNKGNKALLGILIAKCMSDFNEIPRLSNALLRTAIERGHRDLVEFLLQKGALIGACNDLGQTALFFAVQGNHTDIVQLLIKAGANIEAREWDGGYTPLALAAAKGYIDIATQLIKSKARIEPRDGLDYTPLLLAVERGHRDMVLLLLEKGCNIEATGMDGETPLMQAAKYGYEDVAGVLLEKGANVEAMDEKGQTPLIWAIRDGHENVAIQLLEKGSNIEAMNEEGQTPLMWAIRKGNSSLARLLLNRGAKIMEKVANIPLGGIEWFEWIGFTKEVKENIRANSELTLLEFAQQFKETEIIELLSRNGAT